MKNQRIDKNSNLQSDNLKYKIDNFKSKFYNKSEYFICEQDIIGITIGKYLNNMKNFSLLFLKKIKNLIIKFTITNIIYVMLQVHFIPLDLKKVVF